MKRYWWVILVILVVVSTWLAGRGGKSDENIVTREVLHWHSKLSISIKGVPQTIPTNIGIVGSVHQPVHTHDDTGTIHMEWETPPVVVYKDDIRLGRFFRNWGRTFNQNCIFDSCNGTEGQVRFLVNGEPNTEFDSYLMADGDVLEIRYE